MAVRRWRWLSAPLPLLLAACGARAAPALPAAYGAATLPRATLARAHPVTSGPAPHATGPDLTAGAPVIAIDNAGGTAVTLTQASGGYRAVFGAAAATLPQVAQLGDWVAYVLPTLARGHRYLFTVRVSGAGAAYLDVWNGSTDLTTPAVTLGATPHTLSMTVVLPEFGLAVGNSTPQLQVRTHVFPTEVTFAAAVYAATGG